MISTFPLFNKLDLNQKDEIRKFTSNFDPYSDFNFTSLFCWDTDNNTEVSMLNNNLVIKFSDYTTDDIIYSFLGENKIDETIKELLNLGKEINLVPEVVIKKINKTDQLDILEDIDSFDYVYDLADLYLLNGGRHKKKRNKLNSIQSELGEGLRVELMNNSMVINESDLRKVLTEWSNSNLDAGTNTERENSAIEKIFKYSNELDLLILAAYINDEMIGFSINEVIDGKFAICHFEKALTKVHKNIYTYIANMSSKLLLDLGCKYVNWEQDLGLPGLRSAKSNYGPERFLKKYQIKLSSGMV